MSVSECRDINALHPKVKELALKLLEKCKEQGLDIVIGETYRTAKRQDYLYAQGRTRAGNIVTNAKGSSKNSYHQWRLAFDIFNNSKQDPYNLTILMKAGAIGETLGLEWGGSWKGFKDMPHFQYTFGLSIAELKAGKKPPEYNLKKADEDYQSSVKELSEKGIITDTDYWMNIKSVNIQNTEALIIKVASEIAQKPVGSYKEGITICNEYNIITSPKKWEDLTKIGAEDIKAFINKASKHIKII